MKDTIIKYLSYIINRLKDKPQDNPKPISSLAPKILSKKEELERIAPYTNRLKDAIDANGITNIALTGGYGSGKSTILNTFQNLYPNYEYINISLASFKDNKQDNPKENDDLDRQLEVSILQQIFYHVKPSRIPDSRFKRIINLTDIKLGLSSFGLIAWILSTFFLFKFGYIENLNPSTWNPSKNIIWGAFLTTLISFIVFFFGVGCFCRIILRLFINSKINKLNIKGEVELGNDIDKSVFNEHLEEIIYFFQRTEYNILIIEDLDRFNNTDIFTKLREINILLNKSELINREINFIYAIRDEMFTDKTERVKFFEYIIPVISFINPSNAGEQLVKLIKESDLEGVLSKDFTEDVVTFIDDIDMRLLTNIFHEYVLYKDSLKELNQNNLFAIITYKNIFPDDFGKLHKREGYLYKILSKKGKYTSQITEKDREKIIEKELEIKTIQKETVNTITELRAIYIHAILKVVPEAISFKINEEEISFEEIIEDENFNELISSSNIEYYVNQAKTYNDYYGRPYLSKEISSLKKSFSSIESAVDNDRTYKKRAHSIISQNEGKINKLKEEISELKNKVSTIEYRSFAELFQEIDIDNFIQGTPIDIPLIRNLLLNGYINENYNDYISIFHGINMTTLDFSFIRKVKSGVKENFNYLLTNIDQIIKKLPMQYFKREEILNFNLLNYLLQNSSSYSEQYYSIMELIKKETEYSLKFMDEYISNQREQIPFFVQELSANWINLWDYIYEHPTFEDQKKDHYLFLILIHAKLDSIYSLNKSLQLADYMKKHKQFISLFTDENHLDKVTSVIDKFNIHFEQLELPNGENDELFKYIYENNYYYINIHNITLLLNKLYKEHSEGINYCNYTTILNSDCEPLKKYIEDNLTDYLEKVFLKLPHNVNETEETIFGLLNNNDLAIELRSKIIDKQVTKITDNSKSKHFEIDTLLFKKNKMEATWDNIIRYFNNLEEKVIDDALILFLNIEENYKALNNQEINIGTKEILEKYEGCLIRNNQLSIEGYKALIIKFPGLWDLISFSELEEDKVQWLIENKLSLTKSNLDILKSHYPTISIDLIEKKRYELISKYDELELNIDDHIKILQSSIIDQLTKEKIIEKMQNEWIIENDQLKALIENVLYQSTRPLLEYGALNAIAEYSKSIDKSLHLIYNHIGELNNREIQSLLEKLGYKYKNIFLMQKKPTFSYTPTKEKIFKLLERKGMISSCKVNEDKSEIKVVALYK